MKVLFMGTPEFAVASLERLYIQGYDVVGAVTREDKPVGRHSRLQAPPVKVYACSHGIPVYQPAALKDNALLPLLRELTPDLIVVVAYGKILPSYILEYPKYGCINVHASLLPKYRGAAPIHWAVIQGETVTGITTMHMAKGIDTGDMILSRKTEIGCEETAGELHDRLMCMGAQLLAETVDRIIQGTAPRIPQIEEEATYAPMLSSETGHINWSRPGREIINLIRGTNPWPAAYTKLCGKRMKVFKAEFKEAEHNEPPGCVVRCCGDGIVAACSDGYLCLREIQAECCKRMSAVQYLCGNNISERMILE